MRIKNQSIPRKPTQDELEQLVQLECVAGDKVGTNWELQIREEVAKASIAVFDNYSTDFPDYWGKVMCVIYTFGVACYAVYVWKDGELCVVGQHQRFMSAYHASQTFYGD